MYRINEIFYSLQGEGYHTGRAAVFIRFAGCNLHCDFCDTDWQTYTEMTKEQIMREVCRYPKEAMVVLTGGEPSLQVKEELILSLHDLGYTIAIETNGTHTLPNGIDWITCSPKQGHQVVIDKANEIKVVYTGQDIEQYRNIPAEHYYLQPCSMQNTAEVIDYIKQHPRWRLSLQTHKYLNIQ